MKKRFFAVFMSIITLISLIPAVNAGEIKSDSQKKIFLALGDSISTGFGLEEYTPSPEPYAKDSFVNRTALKAGFKPVNLAKDGASSSDLDNLIKQAAADQNSSIFKSIKSASVIDITTGGNDMLKILAADIIQALEADPQNKESMIEIKSLFEKIADGKIVSEDLQKIRSIIDAINAMTAKIPELEKSFSANLSSIIAGIKKINPDARIIVQTMANPYVNTIRQLEEAAEKGITALNKIITDKSKTEGFICADVYSAFQFADSVLTNASDKETYLDPHPNKYGHALIADTVLEALGIKLPDSEKIHLEFSRVYTDLKETDWFYKTVSELIERNILEPGIDEKFNGQSQIKKGEAVKMIINAFRLNETIDSLKEAGVLPDNFNPDEKTMRQELFVIIYNVMKAADAFTSIPATRSIDDFKDKAFILPDSVEPINALYNIGIIKGNGTSNLEPVNFATKAETAQIIYNLVIYLSVKS